MKWGVEMLLENIYGGDGEVRYESKEMVKLSRVRTHTTLKDSIGVRVPFTTEEEIREKKLEAIATFRLAEDGTPMLRLGGAHGKLWGALKSCARQLYQLGDEEFRRTYKIVMDMITVRPSWVRLETEGELSVEGVPQVLKGPSGGMIVQNFDVIPTARATVQLSFPRSLEPKVEKLLEHLERGTHLNKRRTMITVKEVKRAL